LSRSTNSASSFDAFPGSPPFPPLAVAVLEGLGPGSVNGPTGRRSCALATAFAL
jgi:hypothetical protein